MAMSFAELYTVKHVACFDAMKYVAEMRLWRNLSGALRFDFHSKSLRDHREARSLLGRLSIVRREPAAREDTQREAKATKCARVDNVSFGANAEATK